MKTDNIPLANQPQRWAVLQHDHPFLHWDLLLERSDAPAAATWRLLRWPSCGEPIAAEPLPDHRVAYFELEGPVSGGRGTVKRLQHGEWGALQINPVAAVTRPHDHATTQPFPADLTNCHGQSPLLKAQFSGSPLFSFGTLFSSTDGRQFWIFASEPPNQHSEVNSPLVRVPDSW